MDLDQSKTKNLQNYLNRLNLSVRAYNVFVSNFISVEHFLTTDNKKFFKLKNAGKKTILELSTLQSLLLHKIKEKDSEILSHIPPENQASLYDQVAPSLTETNFHMIIARFHLSVRSKNILINNFVSIEDFCNASKEELLKLNNSGASSVREMIRVQKKLKKTNTPILEAEVLQALKEANNPEENLTFKEILMLSMQKSLPEINRPILLKRLAGEITLEQAAQEWQPAVTRERIRQIESKVLKKLSAYKDQIIDELNKCKLNSSQVLYLWEMSVQNDFFNDCNQYIKSRKSTLLQKLILSNKRSKFDLDDISTSSISFKPKGAINYQEVLLRLERLEIEDDDIENHLIAFKRPDLISKLDDIRKRLVPKSKHKQAIKYLKQIFKDADKPLQQQEMQEILRDEYSFDAPQNIIGNARQAIDGIYRFTDRGWGYESKFRKLDSAQAKEIQSSVIEHLKNFSPKQFNCGELLEYLKTLKSFSPNLLNKMNELTSSDIDWTLQKIDFKYNELNQLGRKTWSWNQEGEDRLNTMQLAINILDSFGKPMTSNEIKKYIERERSLGNFQLRTTRANPDLIQVSKSKWGLRWRDINLSKHEEDLIFKNILHEFKRGNSVLLSSHIQNILKMIGVDQSITPWQISRIMLRYVASNQERSGDDFRVVLSRKKNDDSFQIIDINS